MTRVLHLEIERCCDCLFSKLVIDVRVCDNHDAPGNWNVIPIGTDIPDWCPLPKKSEASDAG